MNSSAQARAGNPKTGSGGHRPQGGVWPRTALFAGLLVATQVGAQEIAPFRLTGVEGHYDMRYISDTVDTASAAGGNASKSHTGQSSFVNELFLMTHSYIYHPKFLTLDIGGGPILNRQSFVSDAGSASTFNGLYNLTTRATFFKEMPIHGSAFFDHLNPTVTLAPGEVMTQETTRYGFDVGASGAKMPFPGRFAYTHSSTVGQGGERSVNDETEQMNFNIGRNFGSTGSTQFNLQSVQQASRSGSLNLPIQEANSSSTGMSLDTRLNFGSERQYDLVNLISSNSRSYVVGGTAMPDQKDLNVLLNLNTKHSDKLNSFTVVQQSNSEQGAISSKIQNVVSGASYNPRPDLGFSLTARDESQTTTQFTTKTTGLEGGVRYDKELPLGRMQAGYTVKVEDRAQNAAQPQAQIIGERLLLTGGEYTVLAFRRVVSGSLLVTNPTRSQTYQEGLDYDVLIIGQETRLRRSITTRIPVNEEVLVDYAYDTGGTYSVNQFDQAMNLSWSVSRYASAYFRRLESTPRLSGGEPTFALNAVRSDTYGVRMDWPINLGIDFSLGGNMEMENRQETIAPYRRSTDDIYLQTEESFYGLGNFRIGMRRANVEYSGVGQNMDTNGVDLRYWARPWFGVDVSASTSIENSVTGGIAQKRSTDTVNAQWRERKLSLTATLARSRESQGSFERDRMLFQMLLRRDF